MSADDAGRPATGAAVAPAAAPEKITWVLRWKDAADRLNMLAELETEPVPEGYYRIMKIENKDFSSFWRHCSVEPETGLVMDFESIVMATGAARGLLVCDKKKKASSK